MSDQLPRIMAVFQPQKHLLKSIVPDGEAVEFDITDTVLKLPIEAILGLRDDTYETDEFAEWCPAFAEHAGPFAVRVESALETWLEKLSGQLGKGAIEELSESDLALARTMVEPPRTNARSGFDNPESAASAGGGRSDAGQVKTEQEYIADRDSCPCCGGTEISTEHLSFRLRHQAAELAYLTVYGATDGRF
jgi:hypothetical protein